MSGPEFDDGVFDNPAGWTPFYKDQRFEQRMQIVGDQIFTETLVTIRSSPAAVLAQVRARWDWWRHGRIISCTRIPDGSIEMDMRPIWWYVARFRMRILPARGMPDGRGVRMPVLYSGGFEGAGSIDVYAGENGGAGTVLRGRFHGVRGHVRMLFANATTIAWGHLLTESGRLMVPFTRGTGYVGLIRLLERAPSRSPSAIGDRQSSE